LAWEHLGILQEELDSFTRERYLPGNLAMAWLDDQAIAKQKKIFG